MTDPIANGPGDAIRRAPFGANPQVGARGQRTRHRILDAALYVFGEVGIHHGSVERIAQEAGCSRAAFYQYFADKDDVLRHLAAQLALHLDAAVAWLGTVTPDRKGWAALRDLLERWAEVHERHRPVVEAFPAMFESDPVFAEEATQSRDRYRSAISARVRQSDLTAAEIDGAIDLFIIVLPRTFDDLATLRRVAPDSFPETAALDAVTDVFHRALFGLRRTVNVHDHDLPPPPRLSFGPLVLSGMENAERVLGDPATRTKVLEAARDCFMAHGFHGTRIDMIAEAAGVSHGTLYTYFSGKDHVAQVLAMRALGAARDALQRMPDVAPGAGPTVLRRWLGEYNQAQAGETGMIQIWSEALSESGDRTAETAPALDWGRRQLARRLEARGCGEVQIEAAVLLAMLGALGLRERTPSTLATASLVIVRGFFENENGDCTGNEIAL